MALPSFAVTWDYRCPFARNAHEHLAVAIHGGAPWDVTFVPFSLGQVHVAAGGPDVWDDPAKAPDLLAMLAGVAVRDALPAEFLRVHLALFGARHDEGLDLRDEGVVRRVLEAQGVDAGEVLDHVADGWPLDLLRKEHERAVAEHSVFGVPTFISGDRAVFVRLMDRPEADAERARAAIDRVLGLLSAWPELNEFKQTSIPR